MAHSAGRMVPIRGSASSLGPCRAQCASNESVPTADAEAPAEVRTRDVDGAGDPEPIVLGVDPEDRPIEGAHRQARGSVEAIARLAEARRLEVRACTKLHAVRQ